MLKKGKKKIICHSLHLLCRCIHQQHQLRHICLLGSLLFNLPTCLILLASGLTFPNKFEPFFINGSLLLQEITNCGKRCIGNRTELFGHLVVGLRDDVRWARSGRCLGLSTGERIRRIWSRRFNFRVWDWCPRMMNDCLGDLWADIESEVAVNNEHELEG